MTSKISELQVVRLWESLFESGLKLTTDTGEPIKVVCAGRLNDGAGADYKDAVVVSPRGKECGAIEFHVRSSDWFSHGHYKDPAYQDVILHVTMWNDVNIELQGRTVPALSLSRYLRTGAGEGVPAKGSGAGYRERCADIYRRCPERVVAVLEAAGAARFREKTTRFRQELGRDGAPQVLYRGILGALGYVKNQASCRELADRLPLSALTRASVVEAQAFLFGAAGLLPYQCGVADRDDFVRGLERIWQRQDRSSMPRQSWNLHRVRPLNSPVRRLAGMGYLVVGGEGRLLETIYKRVMDAPESTCRLRDDMIVAGDGYWRDHFSFGMESPPLAYLIGEDRAADIVVNVTLPLVYAWAVMNREPAAADRAFRLYGLFPLSASNSVERHLAGRWGLNSRALNSAISRQGLLHIYKRYCVPGRCGECGMNGINLKSQKSKTKI